VSASVRLRSVEEILGAALPSAPSIALHPSYLARDANPGQVFARVVDSANPAAPASIPVVFGSANVGGSITPNLAVTGLSALLGPLGGDLSGGVPASFDPASFFSGMGDGAAKLFGSVALSDIVAPVPGFVDHDQLPRLTSTTHPDRIVTTLMWHPTPQADPGGAFLPNPPGKTTTISIEVTSTTMAGGAGGSTVDVLGEITDFQLSAGGLVVLSFDRFLFHQQPGQKLDVRPVISEVTFAGVLTFVNYLRDFLHPPGTHSASAAAAAGTSGLAAALGRPSTAVPQHDDGGGGLEVDINQDSVDLNANFTFPTINSGLVALEGVEVAFDLNIPFFGDPMQFQWQVAKRDEPARFRYGIFGGGGYFMIGFGASTIQSLEFAIELGLFGQIHMGELGDVVCHAIIGGGFHLDFEATFTDVIFLLFLDFKGQIKVSELFQVSVEVYASFTYDTVTERAVAQIEVDVSIQISVFTIQIAAGPFQWVWAQGNPPPGPLPAGTDSGAHAGGRTRGPASFDHFMTSSDWADYTGAFAASAFSGAAP
jgi:hypothetical protein